MKMNKIIAALLVMLISCSTVKAQMEPVWEAKAGTEVVWNKFAPNGNLICGTKGGKTVALDPSSGKKLWTLDQDHGVFNILPNTPYIYYNTKTTGLLVLNPEDAKVLCDSKKLGIDSLKAYYPIRAGNGFLVYSQMDDREQFWMISLNTGELLWKQDLDLDDDKKIEKGMFSIEMEEDPEKKGLMCDPVGDGNGGAFVAVHDRLMHFTKDGKKAWDIQYPSMFGDQDGFFKSASVEYSRMFPDQTGENLYVFSGAYMSCYSQDKGELAWDKPVKVTGPVKNIIFEENGMVLIPASDNNAMKKHKANFVDYKTGKTFWGEGIKFKGGFVQSAFCEKGIVFITKAYMNNAHYFNILNQETGELLLKKPEKIFPGPFEIEEVKGGILISSKHGANLFRYDSEEFAIDKELKTGGDDYLIKMDAGSKAFFYTSAKDMIYVFDKITLEAKKFNQEKIKLQGGDEAQGMDLFDDGIVLHSEQNVIKFDFKGNELFHKFYKAPGSGFFSVAGNVFGATFKVMGGLATVALAGATSYAVEATDQYARAGMAAMDKAYEEQHGVDADLVKYRQDVQEYNEGMDMAKDELNKEMSEMATMGILNAVDIQDNIKAISERFKNAKATKKYVISMIKSKEHGGIGLAIISKIDGEIKGFLPMKQSKEDPNYTVDPFTNKLFWMPSMDAGVSSYGKYKNIAELEKKGTIYSYDLNSL
jgi:outer membrane protein assembly factor BamB